MGVAVKYYLGNTIIIRESERYCKLLEHTFFSNIDSSLRKKNTARDTLVIYMKNSLIRIFV